MSSTSYAAYQVRAAGLEDSEAIGAIDGSFTTATVVQVDVSGAGFAFSEVPVEPPLTKVFPEDEDDGLDVGDGDDRGSPTFVAVGSEDDIAGFVSVSYAPWNRRLTIEDIEVAPEHRGKGAGRALIEHAVDFARERGAGHIWLEVTNVNAPAIRAYRRMGFVFCGLDTSLYLGTDSEGEQALYMSKPCP